MVRPPKIVCAIMGIHALVTGVILLTGYLHGVAYGAEAESVAWPFMLMIAVFLVDFPMAYLAQIMGFDSSVIIFIWIGGTVMWGSVAWACVKVYRKLISGPK